MSDILYEIMKQGYLRLSLFRPVREAREWVRETFQLRYWPWYDWKPRRCGIEKKTAAYKHELIVSLTSFPARIHIVAYTIRSLLKQSLKPNRVVLWLGEDKFQGKENDLPPELLELKRFGLEIRWCHDVGPHMKLVPSLRTWPEAILVSADDDGHYPRHWLRTLYQSYLTNEHCIHASIVHQVTFDSTGEPEPYDNWSEGHLSKKPLFRNCLQGFAGVLYPPHCLHPDVLDARTFSLLTPTHDDLWFWGMAVRAGTKINRVQEKRRFLQGHMNPRARQTPKLWEQNALGDGNFCCLSRILGAYPEIVQKLQEERNIPD